jgi:subtilisin family serine protease
MDVPSDRVHELVQTPGVIEVVPVRRLLRGQPRIRALSDDRPGNQSLPPPPPLLADSVYGGLGPALDVLEVPLAHELGFLGAGTRIGILDGFFRPDHRALSGNAPVAIRDFVDLDGTVDPEPEDGLDAADHGNGLWSLVAGDWPGTLRGPAPQAGILLARIASGEDSETADEDRWVAGLEWLESQGARVVLSGVGFRNFDVGGYALEDLNGDIAPATLAADEAARRGVLVIAPVGNGGPDPRTLQSPADGDSVIAVGSVNDLGLASFFSAEGPTADGRRKPDLLVPGEDLPAAGGSDLEALAQVQGTEFAGALLAGAAALFIEAFPERGPIEVFEALRASAETRRSGFFQVPRLAPAIVFPDGVTALPSPEISPGGQVTDLAPQFQWTVPTTLPLGLPVTFRLEVAEDSLFQDVVITDSVVGTFARRIPEALPPRTRLYWRVEARSVQGATWATPGQGPILVPSWVTLDVLNDPGGTEVVEVEPEFRWTAMNLSGGAGPLSFELQVVDDREGEVLQSYADLTEERHRLEEPLPFNVPLRWRVIAQARTGAVDTVTSAGPFVVTGGENPPVTLLYQNFPNPFPNPAEGIWNTRIWFDLAEHSRVELAVYDMRGRLVRRLIPGPGCGPVEMAPGVYGREEGPPANPCTAFTWDGLDQRGGRVSPGVYLLRLQAGGVVEVRRVVYWP